LEKILQFGNNQSARAPGAEKVVDVVEKALNDQVMKIRYPVGKDALLYPVIRWFLPDGLWDLLMRQVAHKFQTAPSLSAPPLPSSAPVALVTGATSGFGLETARLLAREGFQVYATYRDPRKLDALRALIQKEKNIQPLFMDVTRPQTVVQGISRLLKKEKRVDLLVNNAGFVVAGFLEDLSDEELQSQLNTNVFGLLRVTRAVLPAMRKQRSGKIINVGSISGRVGFPGIGAYAASKFAVRSITEGLRQEVRPFGIEVGEIAPGSFQTKVVQSTWYGEKVKSKTSPYTPFTLQMEDLVKKEFSKGGQPSQVATLILQAVKSSSLRPVTLAGLDAKTLAFFKWLLPDAWFEGLLKLAFPWSRSICSGSGIVRS
jgi:NAD(P)-dependent dehydrogenase (short-subunit alcohol dehydrogenase family)